MPIISLDHIHADPKNANRCLPETLAKIKKNIQRIGLCPPLIVRPHPEQEGHYILIDGHHRKEIIADLGWQEVECQVWDLAEQEVSIALLTLNQLRGTDNPVKRAELIQDLTKSLSLTDLSCVIPESESQIQDLLSLLNRDYEEMATNLKKQMDEEVKTLPVTLSFLVSPADADIIHTVLEVFQPSPKKDRGIALVALCKYVLGEEKNG